MKNLSVIYSLGLGAIACTVTFFSPCAVTCLLYLAVILLALISFPRRQVVLVTAVSAFLVIAVFLIHHRHGFVLYHALAHGLVIVVLWAFMLLGLQYRHMKGGLESLRSLQDSPDSIFVICDRQGSLTTVSKGAQMLFGFNAEELCGKPFLRLFPESCSGAIGGLLNRVSHKDRVFQYETVVEDKDKGLRNVSMTVLPLTDVDGRTAGFTAVFQDKADMLRIGAEYKRVKEKLLKSEARLTSVLEFRQRLREAQSVEDVARAIVFETARIMRCERCSFMVVDPVTGIPMVKGFFGIDPRIIATVKMLDDTPVANRVLEQGDPFLVDDIEQDPRFKQVNRPTYATKSFMAVPVFHEGEIVAVLNVADSITRERFDKEDLRILQLLAEPLGSLVAYAESFQELARVRGSTAGVSFQRYCDWRDAVHYEMRRAKRYGIPLSVFLIEVKGYAAFLNLSGRCRAEELRRKIKQRLRFNLRDVDQVYMLAADEIAVLLPHLEHDQARKVALSVQKALYPESLGGDVSLGIAVVSSQAGLDAEGLLARAYTVFRTVKASGPDALCVEE